MDTGLLNSLFLRGWLIGLAIAAPVGPIGLLCIQRTLSQGRWAGLASGLGAATADAVYGFIAAFGLAFISGFLIAQQNLLALVGGLFLCYLAVRTFRSEPATDAAASQGGHIGAAYATTFLLTLTNPVTVLSFVAIFAGMGLAADAGAGDYAAAAWMVAGVFAGSASWWLFLSFGVSLLRTRMNVTTLRWINRGAGLIIGAFGVVAVITTFW